MKFQLAINLERLDNTADMRDVARHTLEMMQMAEVVFMSSGLPNITRWK